jgi:hypothetical protein
MMEHLVIQVDLVHLELLEHLSVLPELPEFLVVLEVL